MPAERELTRRESTEGKRRSRSPVWARCSWDTAARSTGTHPASLAWRQRSAAHGKHRFPQEKPGLLAGTFREIGRSGKKKNMSFLSFFFFSFPFFKFSFPLSFSRHSTYEGKKAVWTASTSKRVLSHHKRRRWLFFLLTPVEVLLFYHFISL